ncbi:hypothetical protein BRCH_03053 [Candidatus Burkholderia brachyanthoides]|nr:hypothetical protein BRCH_03053 [Candidatus Burkholderia brachyanthoides]
MEQPCSNSGMPLDEIVRLIATDTLQFQQETRRSIQNLENQLSQLQSYMRRLENAVDQEDDSTIPLGDGVNLKDSEITEEHPLDEVIQKESVVFQQEAERFDESNIDESDLLVTFVSFPAGSAKSKEIEQKEIFEAFHKFEEPIVEWQPVLDRSIYAFVEGEEIQLVINATDSTGISGDMELKKSYTECKKSTSWILEERKGIG